MFILKPVSEQLSGASAMAKKSMLILLIVSLFGALEAHDPSAGGVNPLEWNQAQVAAHQAAQPKTVYDHIKLGFDFGIQSSVKDTTVSIIAMPFKAIPEGLSRIWAWWTTRVYKTAFDSLGLTWNSLAQMNNRIYTLCFPLTQVTFSGMDKRRRAALIQAEEETSNEYDPEWKDLSQELVDELAYAKSFLEEALCCYNNSTEGLLAGTVRALSSQNHKQITFYIERAMKYIDKLIELIKECSCFEEVQQRHELFKRRLGLICSTFEQIAQSVDTEGALNRTGRMPFSKVSLHASSMSPGLLDI